MRCSDGTGLSWGLSTLPASSCTRLWMALRSEGEGLGVAGLEVLVDAVAVAYCRDHCLCVVGALLAGFDLLLRLLWVCVRARGARQRHWLVFCTLRSAPKQSLHVVALLNSILACPVTCDQSSPCECLVSSRRWEVKAREDNLIFDRSIRKARDAKYCLTRGGGCRSEGLRKAAGRRMVAGPCRSSGCGSSGSWAVTNGQAARRRSELQCLVCMCADVFVLSGARHPPFTTTPLSLTTLYIWTLSTAIIHSTLSFSFD